MLFQNLVRRIAGSWECQIFYAFLWMFNGAVFYLIERLGWFHMPPDDYGYSVTEVPAEIWSGLVMFFNAAWIAGFAINDRRPIQGAIIRTLSSGVNLLMFATFTLGSWSEYFAGQIPWLSLVAAFSPGFTIAAALFTVNNLCETVQLLRDQR